MAAGDSQMVGEPSKSHKQAKHVQQAERRAVFVTLPRNRSAKRADCEGSPPVQAKPHCVEAPSIADAPIVCGRRL